MASEFFKNSNASASTANIKPASNNTAETGSVIETITHGTAMTGALAKQLDTLAKQPSLDPAKKEMLDKNTKLVTDAHEVAETGLGNIAANRNAPKRP